MNGAPSLMQPPMQTAVSVPGLGPVQGPGGPGLGPGLGPGPGPAPGPGPGPGPVGPGGIKVFTEKYQSVFCFI